MNQWSQAEKIIVGCCAAAAVLCFLPWWSVSFAMPGIAETVASANAFNSTEGVLAFLFIIATGGLVCADRAGMLPWQRKTVLLAPFASAAGAVVFVLVFLGRAGGDFGPMSGGRTVWSFVALIAMGVAAFQAFKRWQSTAGGASGAGDEAAGS